MARELIFTGWWEGQAEYTCDCCGKAMYFDFDDEDSAKASRAQRKSLREDYGWITTKVDGIWRDFCSEPCRNRYIRKNTL